MKQEERDAMVDKIRKMGTDHLIRRLPLSINNDD